MPRGTLYVVATPLGNLQDISARAVETLSRAAVIACEDTRRTRGLLEHMGVPRPRLVSCHKFNEKRQVARLLAGIEQGQDVALVTDGGSPGLSDPGALLVDAALQAGLRVCPVPGPSAVAAAVSACGFVASSFLFAGFLPSRSGPRRKVLEELVAERRPLVLFEAPHRLAGSSADMLEVLGDRPVTILREMTKLHEEVRRTTLAGLAREAAAEPGRGEYTLVVAGAVPGEPGDPPPVDAEGLRRAYRELLAAGTPRREALALLARRTGLSRNQLYRLVNPTGRQA